MRGAGRRPCGRHRRAAPGAAQAVARQGNGRRRHVGFCPGTGDRLALRDQLARGVGHARVADMLAQPGKRLAVVVVEDADQVFQASSRRSAAGQTATTTRWLKRSTASTRRN